MLTGENGILTQAQRAKSETENAAANEANTLGYYENYINRATGNEITQVDDSNPGVLEGSGTEQEPFVINSIEDLVAFSDNVTKGNTYQNQYIELGQSLDFQSDKSYVNPSVTNFCGYEGELKTELTEGKGFIAIGTTEENPFIGEFNGKYNSINGVYINSTDRNQGVFCCNEGKIRNLKVKNGTIIGEMTLGAVVGSNNGEIENCLSEEMIFEIAQNGKAAPEVGGICGKSYGTVKSCLNKSNINNNGQGGGIVGTGGGQIISCYNVGKVYVDENCFGDNVGGITGILISGGKVENCYNLGEVSIVGNNIVSEETDARYSFGGIVGLNRGSVNSSYNIGMVKGDNQVGGIIGSNSGELTYSYTTVGGKAGSGTFIGAIIGKNNNSGKANNCYYSEDMSAVGGGNGEVTNVEKLNSQDMPSVISVINTNNDFKEDINNINGGYPILYWE